MSTVEKGKTSKKGRQALIIWALFFAATVAINLLIPVFLGLDLRDWTYSGAKGFLLFSVDYAGFFLILPLLLTKGWQTFKKPSFIIPAAVGAVSVTVWTLMPYITALAIVIYAYLHWRFNLSDLGFRTKGWKGDLAAVLLVGSLGLLQAISASSGLQFMFLPAVGATLFRVFGNPASSVENVFYYGFLTERLGQSWNHYAVPFLIGAMYTLHEMSNPSYWYEGMPFVFVFVGVTLFASVYLWRKSVIVIWLSDGFRWFLSSLLLTR